MWPGSMAMWTSLSGGRPLSGGISLARLQVRMLGRGDSARLENAMRTSGLIGSPVCMMTPSGSIFHGGVMGEPSE